MSAATAIGIIAGVLALALIIDGAMQSESADENGGYFFLFFAAVLLLAGHMIS